MDNSIKRVQNIEKYLSGFLNDNDDFYIGLLFDDYLKSDKISDYSLPKSFEYEQNVLPNAKSSVTKANIKGKYIRQEPEEKETVKKHIHFIRKTDGAHFEFNRDYHIYKKVLLHQYKTTLHFCKNFHDIKVVVSEKLKYDKTTDSNMKIKHIMNMFCEIFSDFEIFTDKIETAIYWTRKFEQELLPKGNITNSKTFDEVVEFVSKITKNDEVTKAFQKRLQILQNFNPDIKGKGNKGFMGYIVFGFTDLNFVILESMYVDNATYIFDINEYETKIVQDKQTVRNNKFAKKIINHDKNWEAKITEYLSKNEQKS